MDPYKVLGVSYDVNLGQLRAAFKKIVLKVHPDRGGKQEDFILVKQSYRYIYDSIKKEEALANRESMTVKEYQQQYNEAGVLDLNPNQVQEMQEAMKRDPKLFNQMYEATRVKTYMDGGYANNYDKLIKERSRRNREKNRQIVRYKDPEGVNTDLKENYEKIGVAGVRTYSSDYINSGHTDLIEGFAERDSTDVYVPEARLKEFKSVDEYMSFSDKKMNQAYSNEKLKHIAYMEAKQKRTEALRKIQRMKNIEESSRSQRAFYNAITLPQNSRSRR